MKFLLLCLLATLSLNAFSVEVKVASITSEFDQNTTEYFLDLDDNNVLKSMRYVTILPNGGILEDLSASAEQVLREGVVIVERNGHIVMRLEVENFSVKTGGTVILNYLFNGAARTRNIKKLTLTLIDGQFTLMDGPKKINRLFLVANWVRVLGIVGVREIQTSYKP